MTKEQPDHEHDQHDDQHDDQPSDQPGDAHDDAHIGDAQTGDASEPAPASSPRRRRRAVLATALLLLAVAGAAGAFVLIDAGSDGDTGRGGPPPIFSASPPPPEPGKGPIGPRVELDCPAPALAGPEPALLDPRATAGNPHTLANGAVAARLCEPPPPNRTGSPNATTTTTTTTATTASPLPTTLYWDVDRVVRTINAYPEEAKSTVPPHTYCPADSRPWLTLEILYPDGVRASIPLNLGGCGEILFSDLSRRMARGFDATMTAFLEEQRRADPPPSASPSSPFSPPSTTSPPSTMFPSSAL